MSAELEKIISEIVDKRVDALYSQGFKDIAIILNKIENKTAELNKELDQLAHDSITGEEASRRFLNIENELDNYASKEDIEQKVAETMLKLMPQFKTKISNEIKDHLVAIAKFVIENFKEKE